MGGLIMKKILYFAALMPALILSCNKADQDNTVKETVLSFGIEEATTKTDLTETKSLRWSAGDQFILMDTGYSWRQFTLKSGAGDVAATFSAPGDLSFAADATCFYGMYDGVTYPAYIGTGEIDWDVTLPSEYDVDGNNIKVPLIAYLNGGIFKMVSGALKVDVSGIPAAVSSLVVTANRQIAGTMHMKGEVITVSGTSATDNVITLNFTPGVSQRTFCIPLPVCAEGYTLSLSFRNGSNEQVAHKSATIPAVTSEKIMYAPAISLDGNPAELIMWTGSRPLGNWEGWVSELSGSSFSSAWEKGKTLTIYYTEDDGGGDGRQIILKDGGWVAIPGMSTYYEDRPKTSYSVVLDDTMEAALKEKGLIVTGYYITINKITLK